MTFDYEAMESLDRRTTSGCSSPWMNATACAS
jgi:hypothetical protein